MFYVHNNIYDYFSTMLWVKGEEEAQQEAHELFKNAARNWKFDWDAWGEEHLVNVNAKDDNGDYLIGDWLWDFAEWKEGRKPFPCSD